MADEIVCSGPERKHQRTPQKKGSNGMEIDPQVWIMHQKGDDGGNLKTSFVFSKIGSRQVFFLFGNNISQTGHGQIPADNDADHPGRYPSEEHKHNKCRRDKELVGNRVHDLAEIGYKAPLSGKKPVKIVCDSRRAEYDGRDEGAEPVRKIHQHHDRRYGSHTAHRQTVGMA